MLEVRLLGLGARQCRSEKLGLQGVGQVVVPGRNFIFGLQAENGNPPFPQLPFKRQIQGPFAL